MNEQKTIFWNVDTQRDFMRADGALYVGGAETIEPNLERLTQYAKKHGIKVINTADWHTMKSGELSEKPDFMTTFPPHCLRGTKGAEYVPATAPVLPYAVDWDGAGLDAEELYRHREIVLYKDAFDVFSGNPHSDTVVRYLNPERAVVYGVATNVCVDYAVKGLRERGVDVYVVRDAIKELPGIPVAPIYESWKTTGVKFITTHEMLSETLEEKL